MPTLDTLRPAHPRLLFNDGALADLRQRLTVDPLLANLVDVLRQRSDALADLPPVAYEPVPYHDYPIHMLEVSRAVLRRVLTHAFVHRLGEAAGGEEGDEARRPHADRAWRELENARTAFPDWNPAHFLDTAEMLTAFAFAYDWLYDAWTPEQRATLRAAMVERGLLPGLRIHETGEGKSRFFLTTTSNWNSVCNAGLLAGALALAEDEPDLAARVLRHAVPSLRHAQRGYEPDGASEEGPTYWSYGTEFFCLAAEVLRSALGDDDGLLGTSALARTTEYRLHVQGPTGRDFSYADSRPRSGASFAYALLAGRHGPAPARQHLRALAAGAVPAVVPAGPAADHFDRLAPLLALTLPPAEAADAAPTGLSAFFDGAAQLAMMRSVWHDPRAAYLGFKAGHAIANHSHLDLGSFVLDWAGVRWATDLGPDTYGLPGYFQPDDHRDRPNRWTYFRNNNHGHGTLTLGDALQDRAAVAPFVARGSAPAFAFAVADLDGCYPAHARSWRRGVALVDRAWVAVRDELDGLTPGQTPWEWVLLTEADAVTVDADGRGATLRHGPETLRLVLAAAPAHGTLTAAPARPPLPEEDPNEGITRVAFRGVADAPAMALEVHLVPAPAADRARLLGPLEGWQGMGR